MNRVVSSLLLLASLPSCAVVMASHKEGADIQSIQSLHSREELIALGATSLSSEQNEAGETVEVFQILHQRGSIARALMHGMLDIGTLGVWELAGTPIEGALHEKAFFSVKVTFDKDEQIKRIEL